MKTLTDLYNEYSQIYNGKPKHDFFHFIRVMSMLDHHKTYIRPKIVWWSELYREQKMWENSATND